MNSGAVIGPLSARLDLGMRIHLQNPDDDPLFDFSRVMWDAAVSRAQNAGGECVVGIGLTGSDFVDAMAEAEALICDTSMVRAEFPCPAP